LSSPAALGKTTIMYLECKVLSEGRKGNLLNHQRQKELINNSQEVLNLLPVDCGCHGDRVTIWRQNSHVCCAVISV